MKKYITASVITVLASMVASRLLAQTGSTYVFFKPIYAFSGVAGKLHETNATAGGVTYTSGVYGSYGHGLCLQGGIGKMLNTNFGVELAGEWVNGAKIRTGYSSDSNAVNGQAAEKVNGFLLKPMLVLRNSGDLLSFYSKLGLAISVYSKHYAAIDAKLEIAGQPYLLSTTEIDNFKAKVGFTAAFGLAFRVAQSVAVTAELNGQMISLPVKDGHYTRYEANGQDLLPTLNTSTRSWVYKRSTSTAATDPNKPGIKLYEPANFSYIGIGIGLKYYF